MGEAKENDVCEEEELLDYDEEEDKTVDGSVAKATGEVAKKGYVGIHSSGFRDFLLKPELLRAIQDCGFEHSSEAGIEEVDSEPCEVVDPTTPNILVA